MAEAELKSLLSTKAMGFPFDGVILETLSPAKTVKHNGPVVLQSS